MLIFGEPGLEKSNIAALVHFGGPGRGSGPMAALDCAALDGSGADLFGRGDKAGLLELVGKGTLLLKNVHKVRVRGESNGSFVAPWAFVRASPPFSPRHWARRTVTLAC